MTENGDRDRTEPETAMSVLASGAFDKETP
jgi:hypothetical protein